MADKVVFETPFVSLVERDGYVFTHEKRSNGLIVSLLPYRDQAGQRTYLARVEVCPAHSPEPQLERCSITGGVDPGQTVRHMAVVELKEEAGYEILESALIDLGAVRPSKSADTTVYLFAIDVSGEVPGEVTGDGSRYETGAYVEWVNYAEAMQNKDPLFIAAIARLNAAHPLP
ncbi:MAG: NUDIX domain-containing protein [Anaerolineae bacterium]